MAFFPCVESSSCIRLTTRGNALVAEPIIEGNPSADSWPYKSCRAGEKNGLHCGPDGMWVEPTFCADHLELQMEPKANALSLPRDDRNVDTDVTDRLSLDGNGANANPDLRFCNSSCYPVIAVVDIQWPWVSYNGADGVDFTVTGKANVPCGGSGGDFLQAQINTTSLFNPGETPTSGTALSGGSRRFFCRLCPGECLDQVQMWVDVRITNTLDSRKTNFVCKIEGGDDEDNPDFTVHYAMPDSNGGVITQVINDGSPDSAPDTTSTSFESNIRFSHGSGSINVFSMPDCNRTDCPC